LSYRGTEKADFFSFYYSNVGDTMTLRQPVML